MSRRFDPRHRRLEQARGDGEKPPDQDEGLDQEERGQGNRVEDERDQPDGRREHDDQDGGQQQADDRQREHGGAASPAGQQVTEAGKQCVKECGSEATTPDGLDGSRSPLLRVAHETRRLPVQVGPPCCGIISGASLASGQAVRRLTLDQEIEGSNPSSPASSLPGSDRELPTTTSGGPGAGRARRGLRQEPRDTPKFT